MDNGFQHPPEFAAVVEATGNFGLGRGTGRGIRNAVMENLRNEPGRFPGEAFIKIGVWGSRARGLQISVEADVFRALVEPGDIAMNRSGRPGRGRGRGRGSTAVVSVNAFVNFQRHDAEEAVEIAVEFVVVNLSVSMIYKSLK